VPDIATILPVLKAFEWRAQDVAWCRPLSADLPAERMPWLAFGWESAGGFQFLARDTPLPCSVDELEAIASRNLRARRTTWQVREVEGPMRLAMCSGDPLAAERVLDPGFQRGIAAALGARTLAVAVPHRGFLVATDAEQDPERLGRFATAAMTRFRGADTPITPFLLLVGDGHIRGRVSIVGAEAAA
jgi:uncharacterized protein YtpQ (UPF0354 family)